MVKLGLVLCVAIAVTTACSGESPDSTTLNTNGSGSSEPSSSIECTALLPDEAFTALGWSLESEAAEHAGRCERRTDDAGAATVGTRAVPDPGAESAVAVLESHCEELRSSGQYVFRRVAWLGSEVADSCFADLGSTRTGVAELYFVNSVDSVVQVRVEALQPLEAEQVEQAMSQVANAASQLAP